MLSSVVVFFFSSRRRHTRFDCDWSSDVCSSDLVVLTGTPEGVSPIESGDTIVASIEKIGAMEVGVRAADGAAVPAMTRLATGRSRSEERRVGKECRARWSAYHENEKTEMRPAWS